MGLRRGPPSFVTPTSASSQKRSDSEGKCELTALAGPFPEEVGRNRDVPPVPVTSPRTLGRLGHGHSLPGPWPRRPRPLLLRATATPTGTGRRRGLGGGPRRRARGRGGR